MVQSILDVVLLIPVLAFVSAVINTILIVRAFGDKPWGMKGWLVLAIGGWIPWSGFTVLMRLADSQNEALWYLRFSFISLQITSYALYRFHHLLVFRSEDTRLATYGMAIIVGTNIAMSFNTDMLNAVQTQNGDYYTDQFHILLLVLNLILNFSAAYWSIRGLRKLELMSASFYTETGERKLGMICIFDCNNGRTFTDPSLVGYLWR